MNDARLTIRVPRNLLEEAQEYARENQTTLTRLVSHYLRELAAARDPLADAPIVRRLSALRAWRLKSRLQRHEVRLRGLNAFIGQASKCGCRTKL